MPTLPLQSAYDPVLNRRVNWYKVGDTVQVFHPSPFRNKPGIWLSLTPAEFIARYTA
jgi:hypothetical protein